MHNFTYDIGKYTELKIPYLGDMIVCFVTGGRVMYKDAEGGVAMFNFNDNSTGEIMDNSAFVRHIV